MNEKNISHYVTKEGGTEQAFDNEYWDEKRLGIYVDVNTGKALFSSLDKYDSGSGWPSFTKPIDTSSIIEKEDNTLSMQRTEVRTNESHLGHVFDDGPDGGDRFCINSAALEFIPIEELETKGYSEYLATFPYEIATFGAGCFWGVENMLKDVSGVVSTTAGYSGGNKTDPSYKEVSSGKTGHAEVVAIVFEPDKVSFEELVDYFWRLHDPTQVNRQGPDRGTQYRSIILYHSEEQKATAEKSKAAFDAKGIFDKPAATEIISAGDFFPAEDYHQDYSDKNPNYVCHVLRDE